MYRSYMLTLGVAVIGCGLPAPPLPIAETTITVDPESQPTLEEFKATVVDYLKQARSIADKLEAKPTAEEARVAAIRLKIPQPTAEQASSNDEVLHNKIIAIYTRAMTAPIVIKEQRTRQEDEHAIDSQGVMIQAREIRRLCDDIETMLQLQIAE
ncbi:MAG: hypothetical protein JWP89_5603 [Schlesneria sp.]|nr:hypothetical protein [Schlesneria sp.]